MGGGPSHIGRITPEEGKDARVRRVLILEGLANLVVLVIKLFAGLKTGSLTLVGDALHSLTDLANNVAALVVMKIAAAPPDREHPYGHRKFETLAVFGLAMLLTVTAFEILIRAVTTTDREIVDAPWVLPLLIVMIAVNLGIALWEKVQARRLDSPILEADARHTLGDVFTSLAVIAGWLFTTRGWPWMDSVFAVGISFLIFYLAYELFRDAVPVLVDRIAVAPEKLEDAVGAVAGVREVREVRSRFAGHHPAVDVTITVDGELTTVDAHAIATAVESDLRERFSIADVVVHVEPHRH